MKTMEDISCSFPSSLKEALEILSDSRKRGRIVAGGTDLMVQWAAGAQPLPERVVSVFGIPELTAIREDGNGIVIGAGVTHAQIRNSELVRKHLPALASAAATVGGAQIQARGTIAGNVANASPAGDLPPALLITDGFVVVASASAERVLPLTGFFLGYRKIDLKPNELIVRFILPKMPRGGCERFRKLGPRSAQAISKVMGACRARIEKGTVRSFAFALGSVGPTVMRIENVEKWLVGRRLDPDTIAEAEKKTQDEVMPIDDIRSTAEYRKWVSGRILRAFLEEIAAG